MRASRLARHLTGVSALRAVQRIALTAPHAAEALAMAARFAVASRRDADAQGAVAQCLFRTSDWQVGIAFVGECANVARERQQRVHQLPLWLGAALWKTARSASWRQAAVLHRTAMSSDVALLAEASHGAVVYEHLAKGARDSWPFALRCVAACKGVALQPGGSDEGIASYRAAMTHAQNVCVGLNAHHHVLRLAATWPVARCGAVPHTVLQKAMHAASCLPGDAWRDALACISAAESHGETNFPPRLLSCTAVAMLHASKWAEAMRFAARIGDCSSSGMEGAAAPQYDRWGIALLVLADGRHHFHRQRALVSRVVHEALRVPLRASPQAAVWSAKVGIAVCAAAGLHRDAVRLAVHAVGAAIAARWPKSRDVRGAARESGLARAYPHLESSANSTTSAVDGRAPTGGDPTESAFNPMPILDTVAYTLVAALARERSAAHWEDACRFFTFTGGLRKRGFAATSQPPSLNESVASPLRFTTPAAACELLRVLLVADSADRGQRVKHFTEKLVADPLVPNDGRFLKHLAGVVAESCDDAPERLGRLTRALWPAKLAHGKWLTAMEYAAAATGAAMHPTHPRPHPAAPPDGDAGDQRLLDQLKDASAWRRAIFLLTRREGCPLPRAALDLASRTFLMAGVAVPSRVRDEVLRRVLLPSAVHHAQQGHFGSGANACVLSAFQHGHADLGLEALQAAARSTTQRMEAVGELDRCCAALVQRLVDDRNVDEARRVYLIARDADLPSSWEHAARLLIQV